MKMIDEFMNYRLTVKMLIVEACGSTNRAFKVKNYIIPVPL